jgi:dihydrofolate synthase/folylpolyglutamate synthase
VLEPLDCAITTIDFDHQAQLGTTIESIAAEKAGIIKPGTPVVIGRLPAEADAVVARHAERVGAPLVRAHERTQLPPDLLPGLAGAHQRDNAIVALALLETLTTCGFSISDAARREGIADVRWPGRLERFTYEARDVLLDAAHNPAGAQALAAFMGDTGWMGAALVFAAMHDKDARGMLAALAPVAGHIVCTTARTERAASAGDLAQLALECGASAVEVVEDPAAALDRACALSDRVVVAGSMFLIGPLRGILR